MRQVGTNGVEIFSHTLHISHILCTVTLCGCAENGEVGRGWSAGKGNLFKIGWVTVVRAIGALCDVFAITYEDFA